MDATWGIRTTHTFEMKLPNPTCAGEFNKAYARAAAESELRGVSTDSDDWCTVSATDDEIVLSFPVVAAAERGTTVRVSWAEGAVRRALADLVESQYDHGQRPTLETFDVAIDALRAVLGIET